MKIVKNKRALGSISIIYLLLTAGFIGILVFEGVNDDGGVEAASMWIQTSKNDFNNGTFNNTTIQGSGDNAELLINLSELAEWSFKSTTKKPRDRYGHGMASIWGTDKVLLFGGKFGNYNYLNDTWIYDYSDNNWTEVIIGNNPIGRYCHAMVSIHGDDKVILFGGHYWEGNNRWCNDTWVFDFSNNNWTEMNPLNKPSGRHGHAMASAYSDDTVVLFGGFNGGYLNDTWVYNLSKNNWTQKTPTNKPVRRYCHAMAPIYGDDKILLFGGDNTNGYRGDTWIYDLSNNTWKQKSPIIRPVDRYCHTMASINGTDKILLFGGYNYNTGTFYYDDTWIYDLSENSWKEKTLIIKPNARHVHAMAAVHEKYKFIMFGGLGGSGTLADTWMYSYYLSTKNGTFISMPYDTGSNSSFDAISWNAVVLDNTTIKFQLRTATNESSLNSKEFIGLDGITSTYYTSSPTDIWSGHTSDRWVQYKVYLNISKLTGSPSLEDVTISYNCLPDTIIMGPSNGNQLNDNRPVFRWIFKDHDSMQQKAFQLLIDNDIGFENVTYDSGELTTSEQRWEFPLGTNYTMILDGKWYWKVRTKDEDGVWSKYSSTWSLTIDAHTPSSAPTIPINNGFYNCLDTITGIGSDGAVGSGILKIDLAIKRLSDNFYWDGSDWVLLINWVEATGATKWTYDSSTIPWTSGTRYNVQSQASDNATNKETPTSGNIFTIDMDNPTSVVNVPVDNIWLNNLVVISGNAVDIGGSGIDNVDISIKCINDNNFWNGTDWKSDECWLDATRTDQWSYNTSNIQWSTGAQYIILSRAADKASNIEIPTIGTLFMFDDQPPEPLSILINNGDDYTNSIGVILSLESDDTDSAVSQMAFSTDDMIWSDWIPFNTTRAFMLSEGDGEKSIYFRVSDFTGNIADAVSDTIILDTISPQELSIIINEDAKFTNANYVNLALSAVDPVSGIADMTFSYDAVNWLPWETFSPSRAIQLKPGDGEKRIYFKVSDKVGNIANSIFDSIILDTTPPHSLSILINDGANETNSILVSLDVNAIDDTSGVNQMSFSNDGKNWSTKEDYEETKSYNLPSGDGTKTVFFIVEDRVGNTADPISTTIILNTTTTEKEKQIPEKSPFGMELWIFLIIIIIIVILIIIFGLAIIRKKRVKQKLLPAGTLTLKPGGFTAPVISMGQVPGKLLLPQLPSSVTPSGTQQPVMATPVPILVKSTQAGQVTALRQTVQIPQLPQLPPAKIQEKKPEVSTTAPVPTVVSPPPTPATPSEPETPKGATPQAGKTPKVAQETIPSSGPSVHLLDSTPPTTVIRSQPKPSVAETTPPTKALTVTTPIPSVDQQPLKAQIRETPIVTQPQAISPVPTPTVKIPETSPELQKTILQKQVKSNNSQIRKSDKETIEGQE